jgi:hypothetical protein
MRYNTKIYDKYKEVQVFIKLRRLQWAGHVIWMNDGCIPKKAMQWTAYGKRAVGQLKRWEYAVWKDSTKLSGMQAWKKGQGQTILEATHRGGQGLIWTVAS